MNQPVRIVRYLQIGGDVLLRRQIQRGNQPAFILHKGPHAPLRIHPPVEAANAIGLRAAARQKPVSGLNLAIAELQGCARRKMIGAPALIGAPVSAHAVSIEKALIEIGIVVAEIPVEEESATVRRRKGLRGGGFKAEIQPGNSRKMRKM